MLGYRFTKRNLFYYYCKIIYNTYLYYLFIILLKYEIIFPKDHKYDLPENVLFTKRFILIYYFFYLCKIRIWIKMFRQKLYD